MDIADKIAALLRQAESTPFGEEADAFVAKAQELMERYSITQAMLGSDAPNKSKIVKGTIEVVAPYTEAKASLAFAVLRANHCEGVYWGSAKRRVIQFVGYSHDVEATKRLYTSLELQALRALPYAIKHKPSWEHQKTFVNTFLHAYAGRIGSRLTKTNNVVAEEMGGSNLPALIDKRASIEKAYDIYWPSRKSKVTNTAWSQAGATQGRSAADRADVGNNLTANQRKALQ